jgi:hypothetical protein
MSDDPLPPPIPGKTTAQPQSASHGLELRKRLSAWYGGISIWYGNMSIRWKVAIIALALIVVGLNPYDWTEMVSRAWRGGALFS